MRIAFISFSLFTFLFAALFTGACDADSDGNLPKQGTTTAAGGSGGVVSTGVGGQGGIPLCGSAGRTLDEAGLTELAFDDGMPVYSVRDQDWSITTNKTYKLNESVLHEAVRFELDHPAKIYGFKIMWAKLPTDDPKRELEAGLYPDFGYNGFDFWAPDPLWTGTRCVEDTDDEGTWLTYALDEPIVVDHPGLVYVAHQAAPGDPVWWFDGTVEGEEDPCSTFHECQSSYNLPEADKNTFYNGLSFPFQYHFMVRLYVEYTDNVKPADKIFQEVANAPSGKHVAWGDYDNDGFDDLLLGAKLHKNNGDGSFTDVSAAAGLDGIAATGGVWGDYDNDGCLDIFLFRESYSQPDHLMHSDCKGGFTDVTASAGLDDTQSYNTCANPMKNTHAPSAAAAWFDLDADGYLDLYVANFNCWDDYSFYIDTVFRNKGDGSFEEIPGKKGFKASATPSRGVAPVDHDGDGDVDLFVNNYVLKGNLLFDNDGDGTVTERAVVAGVAGHMVGFYYGHTIGAAWGDIDNDGDFDLISANLAHPRFFDFSDKTEVLINQGNGNYKDLAGDWKLPASAAGLRYQETHSVPVLADFDQDGTLDLMITCVYNGRPTDFYWGKGDGTFTLDAYHAGITTQDGWGAAAADYDHDGDMDLFATNLFENKSGVTTGHWLQVRVIGTSANWAALGATVKLTAGNKTYIRHVQGGSGKGGQDSMYLHFGLADATTVDSIEVTMPGGKKLSYGGPIAVDGRVWLYEDETTALSGWAPPK